MLILPQPMTGGRGGPTLMQAIQHAGLTANLQCALDAGDAASYSGGGKWLDTSGNGYDFNRGDGATAGTFPLFNGNYGSRTSFWSFNDLQYFTYDTTNEAWMENYHKNNAALTALFGVRIAAGNSGLFGDEALQPTNVGLGLYVDLSRNIEVNVGNGGAGALLVDSDNSLVAQGDHILGLSLNEAAGAGGSFFFLDGEYAPSGGSPTFDGTYTSPSAAGATFTFQIAAMGNAQVTAERNSRMYFAAFWSSALTINNIVTLTKLLGPRLVL